jgi:plasmid maintenance system antidote protein VapI
LPYEVKNLKKTIIAIIKEESVIAHEMAIKFENVTQIGANFWMRHQQSYDEFQTR